MKYRNLLSLVLTAALSSAAFFSAVAKEGAPAAQTVSQKTSHDFEVSKNLDIFNSIYKELDLFYVDTINPAKTIKNGIDAMLGMTDPYTNYFQESDMSDLKFMTTGSYAGVGAVISSNLKSKQIYITEIYEGMPADKAGLRAGDIFVSVDDTLTDGKTTSQVSNLLRGEPQTTAKVVYLRDGKEMKANVVREKIVIDPVPYYCMLNSNVGFINISSFTDQSYSSFLKAFNSLKSQGMSSLIIDLRSNPGGLLSDATKILNMFLPRNTLLVYTKSKEEKWNTKYFASEHPVDLNIPIVVLVNRNSASASEIVSGTLQDMDRAVILGERTYGKGLVQTTRDLPYGGSLKVTISKYYIPSGRCIQAIDYAKRDEEGFVKRIPDSLTHVFNTAAGREVRDGCGICPDAYHKDEKNAAITYQLYNQNVIFDYVVKYRKSHPSISAVKDFKFNDFDDFKKFVSESKFEYKPKSCTFFNTLKEQAQFDGCYDRAKVYFDSLEAKLKPDVVTDLEAHKDEVIKYISQEIAHQYYYQRGAMQEFLKTDKCVEKAVNMLTNTDEYKAYLSAKVVGAEAANAADDDEKQEEE